MEQIAALPGSVARLRVFLYASAAYNERFRDYLAPYLHYRLSQPVATLGRDRRSGLDQIYARLLAEGQAEGEIRIDQPLDLLVDYLGFMHLGATLRWLHTPGANLAAEFDVMLDLFHRHKPHR